MSSQTCSGSRLSSSLSYLPLRFSGFPGCCMTHAATRSLRPHHSLRYFASVTPEIFQAATPSSRGEPGPIGHLWSNITSTTNQKGGHCFSKLETSRNQQARKSEYAPTNPERAWMKPWSVNSISVDLPRIGCTVPLVTPLRLSFNGRNMKVRPQDLEPAADEYSSSMFCKQKGSSTLAFHLNVQLMDIESQ